LMKLYDAGAINPLNYMHSYIREVQKEAHAIGGQRVF